jgi:alkanesulfonate monooxygenase SsuD/methylene tetrahydromethanopterin reductase-like flavin-dependent oxidoreductase (luciferase family)
MADLKLGILLWNQAGTWPEMLTAAQRIDTLGYDHLWAWDHLYAIFGDPYQPILDGWTMLTGFAPVTRRARLGLLVGANTFRNPGLMAKNATSLDHVSNGRAILGLGGAWFELEHRAHGIDFGKSPGERLNWLDEAAGACRTLLDGGEVTSEPGAHYAFDHLRHQPLPIQKRLPIMIGGSGEKKTLRIIAKYADMWNGMGSADMLARKEGILREHCEAVGRDQAEIERTVGAKIVIRDNMADAERVWADLMANNRTPRERWDSPDTLWLGPPQQVADQILARRQHGFGTLIVELPAPYDQETIERLIGEVKPIVDRS